MKLSDFDYNLPLEFIAQHPIEPRDSSRLLVLDRKTGAVEHKHFHDVIQYIHKGDTLVFNDSRVIPARIKGMITGTERHAEILLLKQLSPDTWEALVRPGRKLMPGACVSITGHRGNEQLALTGEITARHESGIRVVKFSHPEMLDSLGEMPLPPYIKARLDDRERYQTVYSSVKGSAAAPTAGLHFTPELLKEIRDKGVNTAFVTLHIGLDTFQPVRAEDPSHHQIHTEFGTVSEETANLLNTTRQAGKRVIAVGTTSVRLLEAVSAGGMVKPFAGPVGLFILPGYQFKSVDSIITNFHLPKSTLLMMISAFAGRERILQCYETAKSEGYRFYSFGDAMLIL
ncbi:MAG: tRNA preQ1(34) S-adenosylmethionine ribosyltransferase-isomerase QueA [Dehalococcoidia bacterium]|jgi:S-adenosylmethionine:tRNA ribosyltransferase-isomerase